MLRERCQRIILVDMLDQLSCNLLYKNISCRRVCKQVSNVLTKTKMYKHILYLQNVQLNKIVGPATSLYIQFE